MIRAAVLFVVFVILVVLLALARRIKTRSVSICSLSMVGIIFVLFWAEVLASTGLLGIRREPLDHANSQAAAWTYVTGGDGNLARVVVPRGLLAMDGRWPGHVPSKLRLMVVGDSFAAGQGVQAGEEFAALVAEDLRRDASPRSLELIKHVAPSLDFMTEAVLYRDYSANYAPDVLVWVFVLNDLRQRHIDPGAPGMNDYIVDRTLMGFEPSWSRAWDLVRLNLNRYRVGQQMEEAYRATYDPHLNGEELAFLEAELSDLTRETTARGARFVFVVFPLLHRLGDYPFRKAHETLVRIGGRAGAETIDLLPFFEGKPEQQFWVSPDDHHPNALGHRIAARAIVDHVRRGSLPSAGPRTCGPQADGDEITHIFRLIGEDHRDEAHRLVRDLACRQPEAPQAALAMAGFHLTAKDTANPYLYAYRTVVAVEALQARALAARLPGPEREDIESKVLDVLHELVSSPP